jgi:hypothetical protein
MSHLCDFPLPQLNPQFLTEIPNFQTLKKNYKQLIKFSGIISSWNTFPTEIPNFQTLKQIFKQLIKISGIITPWNRDTQNFKQLYPIQQKYPIFTPLT